MEKRNGRIYFASDRELECYLEYYKLKPVETNSDNPDTTIWTNGRGLYLKATKEHYCNEVCCGTITRYKEWMDWDEIHERWRQEGKE